MISCVARIFFSGEGVGGCCEFLDPSCMLANILAAPKFENFQNLSGNLIPNFYKISKNILFLNIFLSVKDYIGN